MKELLIITVIFATTCLLLLLRSLIAIGQQETERHYRIHRLYFDDGATGSDDAESSDEWPSIIGLDDGLAAQLEKPTVDDEQIEWTFMQERVFRLLP